MIRRPPRSTQSRSSAASDVYKRQPRLFSTRNPFAGHHRNNRPPPGSGSRGLSEDGELPEGKCRQTHGRITAPQRENLNISYTIPSATTVMECFIRDGQRLT